MTKRGAEGRILLKKHGKGGRKAPVASGKDGKLPIQRLCCLSTDLPCDARIPLGFPFYHGVEDAQ